MRRIEFANGEFYHIYNRGVDHRQITLNQDDSNRFIESLRLFNTASPLGGIYEASFLEQSNLLKFKDPLVDIISYCLNPNHFHLCLCQRRKNGISEFLKNVSGGYSRYFNKTHKRTGALFEGRYKIKHISNNNYLLHINSYINLNYKVHGFYGDILKLVRSSWIEYISDSDGICTKGIIEKQFGLGEYEKFALDNLKYMREMRGVYAELKDLLF